MGNRKDGGPAYPVFDDLGAIKEGMSIRDHFAGLAMGPLMDKALSQQSANALAASLLTVAGAAYDMADMMLKAREQ